MKCISERLLRAGDVLIRLNSRDKRRIYVCIECRRNGRRKLSGIAMRSEQQGANLDAVTSSRKRSKNGNAIAAKGTYERRKANDGMSRYAE